MGSELKGRQISEIALIIIASVCLAVALIYTRSIMVPFVLAGFIVFIVSPLVELMESKLKLPRIVALLATAGVVVLGILAASFIVSSSVKSALGNIDGYKESLVILVRDFLGFLNRVGLPDDFLQQSKIYETLDNLPVFDYVQKAAGTMLAAVSDTFLVILFVSFLLTGGPLSLSHTEMATEVESKVRIYLVTKLVTSTVTAVLVAAVLASIGVDMALMFGFLAFILNFIPTFGSLIATALPLPIALISFGFSWQFYVALGVPAVIQFAVGNVIEPKLMGDQLDLHPVSILLSLMFWGLIWGIPGMILATPILVTLKIMVQRFQVSC